MTGEALMTQDSGTFQFCGKFFRRVLKRRNFVAKQQIKKFRARQAEHFRAFAGRDAAFVIPLHDGGLEHSRLRRASSPPNISAAYSGTSIVTCLLTTEIYQKPNGRSKVRRAHQP